MDGYLKIANDPILWVISIPAVLLVLYQAYKFTKLSYKASKVTDLSKKQCNKAFKVGAISAIGPSFAVFIVLVGMMSVIGAPITWLRLSFIGAAPTELTAAAIGGEAMGVQFGSPEYGVTAFASSVWVMSLNGIGWLLFCGFFTHKLDVVKEKVAGGNQKLMSKIAGAAVLGTTSFLVINNSKGGYDKFIAAIIAAITMLIIKKLSQKIPQLNDYSLGIAMVVGMFVAVFFRN